MSKVGQFFSRVAYELGFNRPPQANAKLIGEPRGAYVSDEFVTVAQVELRGRPVTAVISGELPSDAYDGKKFRVSVGPGACGVLYEQQTGMRPEVRLQVIGGQPVIGLPRRYNF